MMENRPLNHSPEEWTKIKQRVASYLLTELKAGVRSWYFISVSGEKFVHGVYVHAYGPTDAWRILHTLGLVPDNVSTRTTGPLSDDKMDLNVPESHRWRPLSKEELNLPGQEKLDAEAKTR